MSDPRRPSLRDELADLLAKGGVDLAELDALDAPALVQRARTFLFDNRCAQQAQEQAAHAATFSIN